MPSTSPSITSFKDVIPRTDNFLQAASVYEPTPLRAQSAYSTLPETMFELDGVTTISIARPVSPNSDPVISDTFNVRIRDFAAKEDLGDTPSSTSLQIPGDPLVANSSRKSSFRDVTDEDRLQIFGEPASRSGEGELQTFAANHGRAVGLEDFDLLKIIGQGAFGKVFLVRKKLNNKLFAMKVLRKATLTVHKKTAEHTRNERSILEQIQHPFIAKLWFAFQSPSKLFLILGYAPGGELFSHLARERMLSEDVASFYAAELLLALEHLHSLGIIYRDLKPENVLLDAEGHVILTDFGLSKVALNGKSETICGTVEFTAPEILAAKPHGYAVDHWSLGVMLYDMITGSPPFTGQNRKKVMEAILQKKPTFPVYVSSFARDLLTRLLRKDPDKRIGSGPTGGREIQSHSFFRKIDWKAIARKEVNPPIVPTIVDLLDTSNFDKCFTSMPVVLDSPPSKGHNFPDQSAGDPQPGSKAKSKKKKAPNPVAPPSTNLAPLEFEKRPAEELRVGSVASPLTSAGSASPSLLRRGIEALKISGMPVAEEPGVKSGDIAHNDTSPKLTSHAKLPNAANDSIASTSGIKIVVDKDSGIPHFEGFTYVAPDGFLHEWENRRKQETTAERHERDQ
ncbi:kinase-like domain-containing protein [Zopfochytrium polystomum]|nr:kinase-like domain-containing protein [Zopfochytrium polystomum]